MGCRDGGVDRRQSGWPRGQWLRWQVNYRFSLSWEGDWHYRPDTLNLAYGEVDASAFLGVPTQIVDERARLW